MDLPALSALIIDATVLSGGRAPLKSSAVVVLLIPQWHFISRIYQATGLLVTLFLHDEKHSSVKIGSKYSGDFLFSRVGDASELRHKP